MKKSKEFYYLLGLFAGDGWFQSRGISIGTKYSKRAIEIALLMAFVFDGTPIIKRRIYRDGHKMFLVSFYSVNLENVFRSLLGNPPREKSKNFRIPLFASAKFKRAFIKGLFDAESYEYVWRGVPRIGMEIFNAPAAEFIREELNRDGVRCSLSHCSDGGCRLDVTGVSNVDHFHFLYD
jgi:intein/homing endonuclease